MGCRVRAWGFEVFLGYRGPREPNPLTHLRNPSGDMTSSLHGLVECSFSTQCEVLEVRMFSVEGVGRTFGFVPRRFNLHGLR